MKTITLILFTLCLLSCKKKSHTCVCQAEKQTTVVTTTTVYPPPTVSNPNNPAQPNPQPHTVQQNSLSKINYESREDNTNNCSDRQDIKPNEIIIYTDCRIE